MSNSTEPALLAAALTSRSWSKDRRLGGRKATSNAQDDESGARNDRDWPIGYLKRSRFQAKPSDPMTVKSSS